IQKHPIMVTRSDKLPDIWSLRPNMTRTLTLYLFVTLFRLYMVSIGGGENINSTINFGVFNQWMTYFISLNYPLFGLLVLQYNIGKWPSGILVAAIVMEFFIAVISGWTATLLRIFFLFVGGQQFAK